MESINWELFKSFKERQGKNTPADNFVLLLEFVLKIDKLMSPHDLFLLLKDDSIASQMLEKRMIANPESLEEFMYQNLRKQ